MTFDAGSNIGNTYEILNILEKYKIKSTFFLTGKYVKTYPQAAKAINLKGHELGNHSYSHPQFTRLTPANMQKELKLTYNEIVKATGKPPQMFFRPPYGSVNSKVLQAVGDAGYKWTIMWSTDTLDWKGVSAWAITTKVMNEAKPGGIVLMHVGSGTNTPAALKLLIPRLKAKGYTFAAIGAMTEAAGQKVYLVKPGDTLCQISRLYQVAVGDLIRFNKLTNPDLLEVGQKILIP